MNFTNKILLMIILGLNIMILVAKLRKTNENYSYLAFRHSEPTTGLKKLIMTRKENFSKETM